jgi:hypothetical protein
MELSMKSSAVTYRFSGREIRYALLGGTGERYALLGGTGEIRYALLGGTGKIRYALLGGTGEIRYGIPSHETFYCIHDTSRMIPFSDLSALDYEIFLIVLYTQDIFCVVV